MAKKKYPKEPKSKKKEVWEAYEKKVDEVKKHNDAIEKAKTDLKKTKERIRAKKAK